jgi:hypothetical protein
VNCLLRLQSHRWSRRLAVGLWMAGLLDGEIQGVCLGCGKGSINYRGMLSPLLAPPSTPLLKKFYGS